MKSALALLMVFAAVLVVGCIGETTGPAAIDTGKVYFSITDKPLEMANVTSVAVTVTKIEIHTIGIEQEQIQEQTQCQLSLCDCQCYPAGQTPEELENKVCGINCLGEQGVSSCKLENGACGRVMTGEEQGAENADNTGEWITVMEEPTVFDLFALTGVEELVKELDLSTGDYNLIRLYISNVVVTYNGEEKRAVLPSGKIEIPINFVVTENSSNLIALDFDLSSSLHVTGDGTIVMAPVIRTEISNNVQLQVQNRVVTRVRAEKQFDKEFGMDENGIFGEGKRINASAELEIGSDGQIRTRETTREEAQQHDMNVRTSGFSPTELTIQKGDTVRWVFRDQTAHRVVCESAGVDSGARYQDEAWSFTFSNTGTFACSDSQNPSVTTTITVEQ